MFGIEQALALLQPFADTPHVYCAVAGHAVSEMKCDRTALLSVLSRLSRLPLSRELKLSPALTHSLAH